MTKPSDSGQPINPIECRKAHKWSAHSTAYHRL